MSQTRFPRGRDSPRSQLQVHGYTTAGRLDHVIVREGGSEPGLEYASDPAVSRVGLSLPCLLFRSAELSEHDELLMQVSWNLLHRPRSIWTASSTSLFELTTGGAADQTTHPCFTATYGDFGLVNRRWQELSSERYYMLAWKH